jgi:hypothetical protein
MNEWFYWKDLVRYGQELAIKERSMLMKKRKCPEVQWGFRRSIPIALRRSDRLFILQEVIFIYEVLG